MQEIEHSRSTRIQVKELLVGDGVIRGAMRNSATGVWDRDMCRWCTFVHDAQGRADRNNQSARTDEHFIDSCPYRPVRRVNSQNSLCRPDSEVSAMHIIHEYGLQLSSTQIFVTSPMTLQNPINCLRHRRTVVN